LDEFNKETARGTALAAAAFLDDLLEGVIAAFLISNKSSDELRNYAERTVMQSARSTELRPALFSTV
jgi:hypothetical protein